MNKCVIFLADGMADEPVPELGGRTPLEAVATPCMDRIARLGASGLFETLPDGFPTSSDVANMSVLGYDVAECYPGRGPIEAVSRGIELGDDDVAWRCNLITVRDGLLEDYSAGHVSDETAAALMRDLQDRFGGNEVSFHAGVSYRNLLILHGPRFSADVRYHKPDSCQGERIDAIPAEAEGDDPASIHTAAFVNELTLKTAEFLASHPLNADVERPANSIWPWSPGKRPSLKSFSEKYAGARGAVISAVDVIKGIGQCAGMDVIEVPGATGFLDTNYEGKARAAIEAIRDHDLVYLHVEAIDECGHMGELALKMKAIEQFENRVVKPVVEAFPNGETTFAILPDHPVPVRKRKHTRDPVPVAVAGPTVRPDGLDAYSERLAPSGSLGRMRGERLIRTILNLS